MPLIELKDFNFSYASTDGSEKTFECLHDINLEINYGDFVLLCGPSGCGKTTLLSNLKKELIPNGLRSGIARYNGIGISQLDDETSACDIGYLFQNPDSQIVTDTVIQEIAFPLENIGVSSEEIRNRISELAAFFGLNDILHKNVNELSGGQKQLVNLCSLLVLRPKVLLLDEPMSQLDPIASYDFLSILRRLNEEFSITIIISEHKSDNIFSFVDKVVFMENGMIKYDKNPREVSKTAFDDDVFKHYLPQVAKIHNLLGAKHSQLSKMEIPLSIREARRSLNTIHDDLIKISEDGEKNQNHDLAHVDRDDNSHKKSIFSRKASDSLIQMNGIYFAYIKGHLVLKNLDFDLKKGDFIGIIGGNGVGKSTFLQLMCGLLKPIKGKVKYQKDLNIAYVHQNPMIHFSRDNVKAELVKNLDIGSDVKSKLVEMDDEDFINSKTLNGLNFNNLNFKFKDLIEFFGISHLLSQHPYDCSGGEQQKIVIIQALLKDADVLVLDEPTKGLDPISSLNLSKELNELNGNGLTIVMTSHDLDFVANNCRRCLMFFDMNIQIDSPPKEIFRENNFYTTFVNRMVKDYIPQAVTIDDVCSLWDLDGSSLYE